MSAAVLVIYDGKAEDPAEFLRYYIEKHLPIVWSFPRIRQVQVERVVDGDLFMIARFLFDTPEDARVALSSPERERARVDRANFPAFTGTVRHQIVEVIEVPHERP
jgi:uncharacterized protein (TIGR02118 family)